MRSESSERPEKRLMLAVLVDAIATFQKYALGDIRRARYQLKEVDKWFTSKDVSWPFSFQSISAALDIMPLTCSRT
jgi:hypothetical protein